MPRFYAFMLFMLYAGNIVLILYMFSCYDFFECFLGLRLFPAIKHSIYILTKIVHLISHSYGKLYVFNAPNLVN